MVSAVWLFFLAFPIGSIVADNGLSDIVKATSLGLIAVFAGVYLDGFRVGIGRLGPLPSAREREATARVAVRYLVVLVVLALDLFALVGAAAMGVVPFIVSFASFHFSTSVAVGITVVGATAAAALPISSGEPELASLGAIVLCVGLGTALVRWSELRHAQQSESAATVALVEERNRIARDVHDVLGHSLTGVVLKVDLSRQLLDKVRTADSTSAEYKEQVGEQLDELAVITRRALAEIRSTVVSFRAPDLGDELASAEVILADAGVLLERRGDVDDIDEDRQEVLAWVVRESVTNVVRHAGASRCVIELADGGRPILNGAKGGAESVWLRVSDDGLGASATETNGTGLVGLAERIESAGAELRVGEHDGFVLEVVGH